MVSWRYQRQPALRGRLRTGIESDQGSRPAVAGADRSLFSCCRQRVGKGPSRACRVDADPEHLGPPRGQSRFDPRRRCLPEGGGPTLARINIPRPESWTRGATLPKINQKLLFAAGGAQFVPTKTASPARTDERDRD